MLSRIARSIALNSARVLEGLDVRSVNRPTIGKAPTFGTGNGLVAALNVVNVTSFATEIEPVEIAL